jgi:polysaccharide export outer membrane protein
MCEQDRREGTRLRALRWGAGPFVLSAAVLIGISPLDAAAQAVSSASPASSAQPATSTQPASTAQPASPAQSTAQPAAPTAPVADGAADEWKPWTGGRYRITPADVLELRFPFVPELDQTLSVHPDGHITLREVGDLRVQGRTLPELRTAISEAYAPMVRNPEFTIVLKEFEKPYFVAAGQVARPGRYDLRGATTLTQALAFAGGPNNLAKISEVVIFRHLTDETVSVRQVNVKEMYAKRNLHEDPILRPGDTIYIPKSTLGKLEPILSKVSMGVFLNPYDFTR